MTAIFSFFVDIQRFPLSRGFGTERMLDALNRDPDASPKETMKNVRNAVNEFVKEAEQFDDLTMVCLEYKGVQNTGEKQDSLFPKSKTN